ncbi:MAG: MarR family winged helix-turn-helix transcriptional regulator [Solirubrobacterales bacterium]
MRREGTKPQAGGNSWSSLAFLLSQVGIFSSRRFHQAIGEIDLHPGWFLVLNVVDATEGSSQQEIAEATEVPPSRMVAIVDELEQRGLVERRPHPGDRRIRALYLTANGRRVLGKGRQIAREHDRRMANGMSAEEHRRLVELLQKLSQNQGLGSGVHPGLSEPEAGR